MVDATKFLLRWLYLSNMVRDVAEIQTLPYQPMQSQYTAVVGHTDMVSSRDFIPHVPPQHHASSSATTTTSSSSSSSSILQEPTGHYRDPEEEWKHRCLRGVLSFPPGTQRLFALDTLRLELVQQLAHHLRAADSTVKEYSKQTSATTTSTATTYTGSSPTRNGRDNDYTSDHTTQQTIIHNDDPFLDTDLEIVRAFERATSSSTDDTDQTVIRTDAEGKEAALVISNEGTNVMDTNTLDEGTNPASHSNDVPSEADLSIAFASLATFRDYLPQLMSAVLMSPGALQPALLNPVQKLRRVLLTRCVQDANWGIELCWLLEAEVGRAWKSLFEHRQQTGRRLIVVLPAEKAAVLAKIGMAKRAAFELLQEAEHATAYGYLFPSYDGVSSTVDPDLEPIQARLPSSLSLRRCSHYGDTMHFIDRLTNISMNLRLLPPARRHEHLLNELDEINRRLRRRMVTRGDVSLDVEDNLGAIDWPHTSDVTVDMLKYSVHLPLQPKKLTWPGGETDDLEISRATERSRAGVMRVLNVVTPECRLLSSRERCPYLVHLEVAETGLEGNDARLYASGASGLGTTIGESLSMLSIEKNQVNQREESFLYDDTLPSYKIPSELMENSIPVLRSEDRANVVNDDAPELSESDLKFPKRGGYQSYDDFPMSQAYDPTIFDMMHQQEQGHIHHQVITELVETQHMTEYLPTLTTRSALLDRIFGLPWALKCEQIRHASPYGKVKGWRLASFILKAGEDIRREALVMQVISSLNEWFQTDLPESIRPKMRPYTIMCVGGDAGLIECLSDAKSVDEVKKKTDGFTTLRDYFERAYGPPQSRGAGALHPQSHAASPEDGSSITFEMAQDNFLRSLVGYSLICYILQIKDRHNANILIDREGHIMHIDFGYVLGDTPKMGKVPIFSERAPFKLSTDFWEVLGGWNFNNGGLGVKFCKMFEKAFECASSHSEEIVSLVEAALMNLTRDPGTARTLANGIRHRLRMRGPPESVEQKTFVMDLVNAALTSWGTTTYDWLQKNMNGYQ